MNDYTLETINLADPSAEVYDIEIDGNVKKLHIRKKEALAFCPHCGKRMLSKGFQKPRIVKGTGIVGGYMILQILHQRKWFCPACNHYLTDQFTFVDPYKQSDKLLPYLIAADMKDLTVTAAQVANKYGISDTYVFNAFMSVVNPKRLPLTDIICIDEVYMKYSYKALYPMIILDFRTNEPIDIVVSRRKETTDVYLSAIPLEERKNVKYLICDMYESYIHFAGTYFPNAVAVVDSFHVISRLIQLIRSYANRVKHRYMQRDNERLKESNFRNNTQWKSQKESREVYLLNHFYWILLGDEDDFNYCFRKYIHPFGMYMDLYDLINYFYQLDSNFRYICEMKMKYLRFNKKYTGDPEGAAVEFDQIVQEYQNSPVALFREMAETLAHYRKEILVSFTTVEITDPETGEVISKRLSNGPMEAFNNFPKDLKRVSNGVKNPEYTRNRILWARRKDTPLLAVPRDSSEFHTEGRKRGSYKK